MQTLVYLSAITLQGRAIYQSTRKLIHRSQSGIGQTEGGFTALNSAKHAHKSQGRSAFMNLNLSLFNDEEDKTSTDNGLQKVELETCNCAIKTNYLS
jgi:hypothetical protein